MSRIVMDIDGVLCDFTGHLVNWLNKTGRAVKRGRLYSVNEFRDYELTTVMPKEHLKEASHDPNFVHSMPRMPGAQQLLKDLLEAGHIINLVTSPWTGPYHTQAREDFVYGLIWKMQNQGLPITFEWAKPEERVMMPGDFLVDDRYETCMVWAQQKRHAIVIDWPWNRDFEFAPDHRQHAWVPYIHRALHLADVPGIVASLP